MAAPAPGTIITSPPLPNPNAPWYSTYPLPSLPHPSLGRYAFTSPTLSTLIYSTPPTPPTPDLLALSWTGATITQTLTSILLTSVYPHLPPSTLSDLRAALTSKPFHQHLITLLSLPTSFDTYIGAVSRDLGTEKFGDLYKWYYSLLEPYIIHFYTLHSTHRPSAPAGAASSESKQRRQGVAAYTSRLMEYAAKNKLEAPHFEFVDNGVQGAGIQWSAVVSLGGRQVARAVATTKLEAKHLASREALGALRAPVEAPGAAVERRRKKQERRSRGGMVGGGGGVTVGHMGMGMGIGVQQMPMPMPMPQQQQQFGGGFAMGFAVPPGLGLGMHPPTG